MSHLTDLDIHDWFAKPQSNDAALLIKRILPYNTVSRHTALFRSNNVKQNRLEKQNNLVPMTYCARGGGGGEGGRGGDHGNEVGKKMISRETAGAVIVRGG